MTPIRITSLAAVAAVGITVGGVVGLPSGLADTGPSPVAPAVSFAPKVMYGTNVSTTWVVTGPGGSTVYATRRAALRAFAALPLGDGETATLKRSVRTEQWIVSTTPLQQRGASS